MENGYLQNKYIAATKTLKLTFGGDINLSDIATIWRTSLAILKQYPYKTLYIDLDKVEKYDNTFIHLLTKLQQTQQSSQQIQFKSQDYPLLKLYEFYSKKANKTPTDTKQAKSISFIKKTGIYIFSAFATLTRTIIFTGELLCKTASLKKYFKCWVYELYQAGPKSIPIITLIGLLLGIILSFQGAIVLSTFGAQIYIVRMVVISLSRELAPIMTAFVVTGRSIAAFAAEIGTMSVNQEIDALKTMDIDKTEFIILPKVMAITTMLPLLNLYMLLAGFIGCLLIFLTLGYSANFFFEQLKNTINAGDLFEGLLKAMVFGTVIASIGCINGLKAKQGSTAVGMAATRSVVSSIVMIAVLDGIFAVIFYNLGV